MNTTEIKKVIADKAETIYVDHKESSYAIICFNSMGDLFINSDWGFYAYAWRAYGDDFKLFLAKCNKSYLADKLSMNTNNNKQRAKFADKHVQNYCEALISYCKGELIPTHDTSNQSLTPTQ